MGRRRGGSRRRRRNGKNSWTRTKHPSTTTGSLRDQRLFQRRRSSSLPDRRRRKLQDWALTRQRRVPSQLRRAKVPSCSSLDGTVRPPPDPVQLLPSHHQSLLFSSLLFPPSATNDTDESQPTSLQRLPVSLLQRVLPTTTTLEPSSPLLLFLDRKLQPRLLLPEFPTTTPSPNFSTNPDRRIRSAATLPPLLDVNSDADGSSEPGGTRSKSRAGDELASRARNWTGKDEDTIQRRARRRRSAAEPLRFIVEFESTRTWTLECSSDNEQRVPRSIGRRRWRIRRAMDHVGWSGRRSWVAGGRGRGRNGRQRSFRLIESRWRVFLFWFIWCFVNSLLLFSWFRL